MKYAIVLLLSVASLAADISERCVLSVGIPSYPQLAEQARLEGIVKVGLTVDAAGAVVKATGISGHPMLQAAALENVKTWRFAPVTGKTSILLITYEYRIEGQEVNELPRCPKIKLELPVRVEISGPPMAPQP